MDWQALLSALCLMMIIEGLLPFVMPNRARRVAQAVLQTDDRTLRIVGLTSMLIGVVLLTLIRG